MPLYIVEIDEAAPGDLEWGDITPIAVRSFGTPRRLATETLVEGTAEQAQVLEQQGIMVRLAEPGPFVGECESGPCTVTIHHDGTYTVRGREDRSA
jgi:hypothetical protein